MDQKQKERQQRGDDFQNEIRRSWSQLRSWRVRIPDGRGGTRPADELVILEICNLLVELKRTNGDRFELSFLRPNQAKGLLAFDNVFDQNYGVVFVSFLNDCADEAYAFRLMEAYAYMVVKGRRYITMEEFRSKAFRCMELPRETIDGEPGYNLRGLHTCYKYL